MTSMDAPNSTTYTSTGSPQALPGVSGTVWIQIFTADGKDLTGLGHRHSIITDEDSTWTHCIHRFTYTNPAVYAALDAIASSVVPEVIVVMYAGKTAFRTEKHWLTAVHDLPSRHQGSREMRIETVSLLWAMNRYPTTASYSGSVGSIVGMIAKKYGMKVDCNSDSAVQYQQVRQTDFDFIKSRLAKRAVVIDGETYGNFRLYVRYEPNGTPWLSFAPLKTAKRLRNWFAIQINDPSVRIHGPIEFVNKSAVAAASGAVGVRALVIDPYHTYYHPVESTPCSTTTDTPPQSSVNSTTTGEQGAESPTQRLHVISHTIDADEYPDAVEQCTCLRDAARMSSFEAVFTVNAQPWFSAGDKITLVSGLKAPYDGDWFVFRAVTTINEGNADTHLVLITDVCNTQKSPGTQVLQPDQSPTQATQTGQSRQPSVTPATKHVTVTLPVKDGNTGDAILFGGDNNDSGRQGGLPSVSAGAANQSTRTGPGFDPIPEI